MRVGLWRNTLFGGAVFLGSYIVFLFGLKWLWPGYIEAVWNLDDLIGWQPRGLPFEELLFGFVFGMYWSSVYEHHTWRRVPLELRDAATGGERPRRNAEGERRVHRDAPPSRSVNRN